MGYRTYLQTINKKDYEIIKKMNKEELVKYVNEKEEEKFNVEEIYLTIKYIGDTLIQICDVNQKLEEKIKEDIFDDKEMNDLAKNYGHQLFRITKEGLKELIEHYNKENIEYFKSKKERILSLLDIENKTIKEDKYKEYFYRMIDEIRKIEMRLMEMGLSEDNQGNDKMRKTRNYVLDNKDIIVSSQYLEYEIFNLVNLYNNFDWENKILIVEAS